MTCSKCGTANDAASKFCKECGTPLALSCPSCGAPHAPDSKFCAQCGAALTASLSPPPRQPAAASAPQAERRLVSVLFADLVGFTTASEQRDAEETRELLSRLLRDAAPT